MQLLADFIFEFQNENDLLLIISVISCISFFFFIDKKNPYFTHTLNILSSNYSDYENQSFLILNFKKTLKSSWLNQAFTKIFLLGFLEVHLAKNFWFKDFVCEILVREEVVYKNHLHAQFVL